VVARAIRDALGGDIAVPYALDVEGQIVRMFDPVIHETLPSADEAGSSWTAERDLRWARCRRPLVVAGVELGLQALELSYNPVSRFYHAPLQALATGGVLVIDDFGRQPCEPRQLLNRWIGPLESRSDILTLATGQSFELPFLAFLVFATNLKPSDLVDEAFLRRIRYKVLVESPDVDEFARIFRACCQERQLDYEISLVHAVFTACFRPRRIPLRRCHPRDLIEQALALAQYLGRPRRLTPDLLTAACASYFIDDAEPLPVYA
jgi:hypothetical protein